MFLRVSFEGVLRVCKRAEERSGGAECGRCSRGVRERRGHKRGAVRFGAVINRFGIGIEMGVIVVTAVIIILDNVLMCNVVRVRILAIDIAIFVTEKVVAGIDIIVCTNAAGVTDIAGRETDAAVMLSRAIGTLIIVEMRRWKCRGAQVRLRNLMVGIFLIGKIKIKALLLSAIIMIVRIREIGRRENDGVIIMFEIIVLGGDVDLIMVGRLMIRRMALVSGMELILRHGK